MPGISWPRRFDAATGEATLYHEPQVVYALDPEIAPVTKKLATKLAYTPGTPTVIAGYVRQHHRFAAGQASVPSGVLIKGHYNGKIDSPRISSKALTRLEIETMKQGAQPGLTERRNSGPTGKLSETIVAAWEFSDGINTIVGKDKGPYLFDATIVNCPTRAMTGYNWEGQVFDWKSAPEQYGAIHFHDDDIDDARWAVSFEWKVPKGTSSKFYAAKLTSKDGDEDYIPFWVVPRVGEEQSKIAFMVPTISYMAYANEHLANNAGGAELLVYRVPIMQQQNMFLVGASRIWRLDLRHPHRRQRPLPVVAAAADPEHPSEVRSLPGAGAVAIPGRSAHDLLAGEDGIRVRRDHRRGRQL